MVCHGSVPNVFPQPNTRVLHLATASHPAEAMTPPQRQQLALEALAGTETVSRLAAEHAVSRKFVYQQTAKAEEALDAAFSPKQPGDERVLFYLPVTKACLRQLILALTLICHSSLRGVVELLRDLFDYPLSVGTVHNVLQSAVEQARSCNQQQDLSRSASPPPGTGLSGLAPVLPQPPPLPAEPAARTGGQKPCGTAQRQPPSPLAGDVGLRPVLPQLTSRRQPSPSAIPPG